MNLTPLASRLSCLAALGMALAAPAHAEGNRLLPFWGQPYPYGYAWTDRLDVVPAPVIPSRTGCRATGERRRGRHFHCDVVLHARD